LKQQSRTILFYINVLNIQLAIAIKDKQGRYIKQTKSTPKRLI